MPSGMFVFLDVGSVEKKGGRKSLKKIDETWTLTHCKEFHGQNHGRDSYSDRNLQKLEKNHQNHGSVRFYGRGTPRVTVIFKIFYGHYKNHVSSQNTQKNSNSTPYFAEIFPLSQILVR